jgi:predicted DNA-binding WGR domain protein
MPKEVIYLEYSEDAGSSHKFYEVVIDDSNMTIRYGRIGEDGNSSSSSFPSFEDAKKAGMKKAAEKRKKGYQDAVMGVRQRKSRTVTRRPIVSHSSSGSSSTSRSTVPKAPIIWKFNTPTAAFGIFINDNGCWMGNQEGSIFALSHEGAIVNQFRLPDGVKCLVADSRWIYAGCDDGNVYDLTGKIPRIAYEIHDDVDIYWLDIYDAYLGVSDANGNVLVLNYHDESHWNQKSSGSGGWMVRCDANGVYHGLSSGITAYDLKDGRQKWTAKTGGGVLFGWQENNVVYGGCGDSKVYSFDKAGNPLTVYKCDACIYSCAAAENGKFVFAGDNYSNIYCFDESGTRLWKLSTGAGSALSMQYHKDRLYVVTTEGAFVCFDVKESAIEDAKQGNAASGNQLKAPAPVAVANTSHLDTTTDTSGIVLTCIREGGKLRIKVETAGYHRDWNVQFPKDIRQEGAKYVVSEIVESLSGEFYRIVGDIKKLV